MLRLLFKKYILSQLSFESSKEQGAVMVKAPDWEKIREELVNEKVVAHEDMRLYAVSFW
jgi:hypothetical protein